MEYPGAVTYNENLLPQRKNNVLDISKRGSVFLHEISHMWFGNLVTMNWWNGLWLNESFAEFICHKCFDSVYKSLGFDTSIPWVSFLCNKARGYREDQLPSTHPIAGEVEDTQVASSIFDGITYNKGSSVLKQLMCVIGEETFSAALENYFNKYAYKNTTLEDLLNEFDRELKKRTDAKIDIFEWKEEWINSAGLNEIYLEIDETTNKAYVIQDACRPEFPTLRHHFIKIGFYDQSGQLTGVKEMMTSTSGRDEISLDGVENYHAVLLNYDVSIYHQGHELRESYSR